MFVSMSSPETKYLWRGHKFYFQDCSIDYLLNLIE